jgi:type III restriction enzyme
VVFEVKRRLARVRGERRAGDDTAIANGKVRAGFDSDWERQAAELLDEHASVHAWVKNDRLGFAVPYRKDGIARKYFPDFLVELEDGQKLLIEIKGQAGDADVKKAAAERWCRAANNDGRFGRWRYELCFGAHELQAVLDTQSVPSAA